MKIFNLMFGKKLGGLEQASFDYALALKQRGHDVITFLNPRSASIPTFEKAGLQINTSIANKLGGFDLIAKHKMQQEIKRQKPAVCLVHGRRAALFARKNGICPTIAVTHSFNLVALKGVDGLIAINHTMKQLALDAGFSESAIQISQNMLAKVNLPEKHERPPASPPRIGAMGRLIPRKGMRVFLAALKILNQRGIAFQAWLAGTGEDAAALQSFIGQNGLSNQVTMQGWLDADSFYQNVDIFCMPSLAEPFGLVILEAWYYGVPLISSQVSGPAELITDQKDGILVPPNDATALADALEKLLSNAPHQRSLVENGYKTLQEHYLLPSGSERLEKALMYFINKRS